MQVCTNTNEGDIYTYWMCKVCNVMEDAFFSETGADCFAEGEFKEVMPEHWEETKAELHRLSKLIIGGPQ